MKKYQESDDTMSMLGEYTEYMAQYADMMSKLDKLDDGSLSTSEAAYYLEVVNRINQKLLEVSQ